MRQWNCTCPHITHISPHAQLAATRATPMTQWSLCPSPPQTCSLGFMTLPLRTKKSGSLQAAILSFYFNCVMQTSDHVTLQLASPIAFSAHSCVVQVMFRGILVCLTIATSTNFCLSISFIHSFIHSFIQCVCMCVHVHVQDNAEIRKQLSRVHSHLPLCWRCLSYFCLCTANTTLAGWLVSSWLSSIHLHLASHLQIGMMGLHITAPPHLPLTWL
jgi:hypothetical protein